MRYLLLCLLFSCGEIGPFDPKVGDPIAARCVDQDSDANTEVPYATKIAPILRGCDCHLPSQTSAPVGFLQSGLSLESYSELFEGGNRSGSDIVLPGAPCSSVLLQKVSPGPSFGSRMPLGGPPFLGDEARLQISDWIAEGARDN